MCSLKEQIRQVILFSLLGLFLLASCQPVGEPFQTIYIVRHAEKDLSDPGDDPVLTPAGEARADKLREMLKGENVKVIYSTRFSRNINTVLPLGEETGTEVTIYEAHDWFRIVEEIRANPDAGNVLVCGHGNTVLPMVTAFGLTPEMDSLAHDEYDKMFKIENWGDSLSLEMVVF